MVCLGVCSQLCGVIGGDREVGVAEEYLPSSSGRQSLGPIFDNKTAT